MSRNIKWLLILIVVVAMTIGVLVIYYQRDVKSFKTTPSPMQESNAASSEGGEHARLSAKEALQKAEDYVKTNSLAATNLSLVGSYYSKFDDARNNRWTFIWAPPSNVMVLDAEIRVYVDDEGNVTHGGGD